MAASIEPLVGNGSIEEHGAHVSPPPLTRHWLGGAALFDDRDWACEAAELNWTAPAHLIVLTRRGGTGRTLIRPESGRIYQGRDRPGTLSFVPVGVARHAVYERAALSYSAVWIAPSLLGETAGMPDEARINFSDPLLVSLLVALRDAALTFETPDDAYVEHLLRLCLHRIRVLPGTDIAPAKDPKLAPQICRRVEAYIDANLHRSIRLDDLAAIAGVTSDSFGRRFKATTGQPPHAFLVERRVRRAEELLANGDQSIASIALQLGFPNQSHFTATFKRRRGTTPQAYRASFS